MNKKWLEVMINIVFWVASAWLIISSFSIQSQEIEIINGLEQVEISRDIGLIEQLSCLVIAASFMFYLNFFHISRLSQTASRKTILFKSLLSIVQGYVIYLVLHAFLLRHDGIAPNHSLNLSIFSFYFTVSTAYALGKVWAKTEQENQYLALEKKQAELNLLRSQLHPHFLFNVLNNLLSMVDQANNPSLALSIDKLSSLLRYVVYESSGEKVSLKKEIDFLHDFAALQSLRFEEKEVDFSLKVLGNPEVLHIEPGLFLPFIENAFSYGLLPENQSHIEVIFDLEDKERLIFKVQNPIYPELRAKKSGGTGILSIQNRLKLVYPDRHKLSIHEQDLFTLELIIYLNESDYHRG